MIAPGCDPLVIATATSAYVGGVLTGCIVPAMVGATIVVGKPARLVIGSGITAITGCSATSEGVPCAPASARPGGGMGATVGSS